MKDHSDQKRNARLKRLGEKFRRETSDFLTKHLTPGVAKVEPSEPPLDVIAMPRQADEPLNAA